MADVQAIVVPVLPALAGGLWSVSSYGSIASGNVIRAVVVDLIVIGLMVAYPMADSGSAMAIGALGMFLTAYAIPFVINKYSSKH